MKDEILRLKKSLIAARRTSARLAGDTRVFGAHFGWAKDPGWLTVAFIRAYFLVQCDASSVEVLNTLPRLRELYGVLNSLKTR